MSVIAISETKSTDLGAAKTLPLGVNVYIIRQKSRIMMI
jgi:hypothetical protein